MFKKSIVLGGLLIVVIMTAGLLTSCKNGSVAEESYEPNWRSLKNYPIPQWVKDGKFGIYTHWGIYSVPALGPDGTWYPYYMYREDSKQHKHHIETYGPLSEFGYKEFIPMFKAEKFDADEWAELFEKAGAKFAGPVAEHHDGFAMWDTKYSEWNAAKMGPKRDIVGELEKAIKKRNMKFVTTFHHSTNWYKFPVWDERFDCSDPKYSGLYGQIHERGEDPNKEYLDEWYGKIIEVIDKYDPDFIWFDSPLDGIRKDVYQKNFLAYYYNKSIENDKEVLVAYKVHDFPPGVGITDIGGIKHKLTYHMWLRDTSVDEGSGWSYVKDIGFKSVNTLVDNLVDLVSKNGFLLLNVGPKPDGTITEEAKKCLLGIGEWLKVNGEAIYGTTAWIRHGEGPAYEFGTGNYLDFRKKMYDIQYTAQDIRFTVKDNIIYAICLDWPINEVTIKFMAGVGLMHGEAFRLYESEIESIKMLGVDEELEWTMTEEGLTIKTPEKKPCEHAFTFKIERKPAW